jgi:hypothetical protein
VAVARARKRRSRGRRSRWGSRPISGFARRIRSDGREADHHSVVQFAGPRPTVSASRATALRAVSSVRRATARCPTLSQRAPRPFRLQAGAFCDMPGAQSAQVRADRPQDAAVDQVQAGGYDEASSFGTMP